MDKEAGDVQLAARIPRKLRDRLERHREAVNRDRPGLQVSLSACIRELLEQALANAESLRGEEVQP